MNDRRRKFIGEIAGLAKLVSALPAPFQLHILGLAGDMAADPELFEGHRLLYQQQPSGQGGRRACPPPGAGGFYGLRPLFPVAVAGAQFAGGRSAWAA